MTVEFPLVRFYPAAIDRLSPQQQRVLQLRCDYTLVQAAFLMEISVKTAKYHQAAAMAKLEAPTLAAALIKAHLRGWIDLLTPPES